MIISIFNPKDHKKVSTFWSKIFSEMGWPIRTTDGFDNIPAFFHIPEGFLITVKDGAGSIVGCAGVKPLENSVGLIKRFYIAPDQRGKGLAKQLLDEIIKEGTNRKFKKLVLDVFFKNLRAKQFYEKHSFIQFNPQPDPSWPESLSPDKFFYYQINIT